MDKNVIIIVWLKEENLILEKKCLLISKKNKMRLNLLLKIMKYNLMVSFL
jgi:hypothetical protein